MSEDTWVWKLGGSLLELTDFPQRLETALSRSSHRPVFVIGGGPIADEVRRWDQRFGIGEKNSHDLALRAMELNERLVTTVWPRAVLVADRPAAENAWRTDRVPVLQTRTFLETEEPRNASETSPVPSLPHTWDATSDTIAAWITLRLRAEGLMLVKSIDRPESGVADAVDSAFPYFVERIPNLGWINLRTIDS